MNEYRVKQGVGQEVVEHLRSGLTMPYHAHAANNASMFSLLDGERMNAFRNWCFSSNSVRKRCRRETFINKAKEDMFKTPEIMVTDYCPAKGFTLAPLPTGNKPTSTISVINGCGTDECKPAGKYYYDVSIAKEDCMYAKQHTTATPVQISMDVNTTTQSNESERARSYLADRLHSLRWDKRNPLAKQFNLYQDNRPKTFKELIDAIKNDKFKIDPKVQKRLEAYEADGEDDEDDFSYGWDYSNDYGIIWDGPQPDQKGYEAAQKAIADEYQRTLDIIKVMPADKGLEALQAFEAWQPTAATTTLQ